MITRTEYKKHPALELTNGSLRLIAPLSFGPRILHFGGPGGSNLLIELEDEKGTGPGGAYRFRGGHRLWHAPEDPERTYQPDNDPPEMELLTADDGFALLQRTEAATGMRKTMRVKPAGKSSVAIEHEITNEGLWPVTCAVWALTMLRAGGSGVIPLLPKGEHPRDLLPDYTLIPWPYTDFSSGGWSFSPGFIGLHTRKTKSPQKLGISDYPGWLAYWIDGEVFIKTAAFDRGDAYPDSGSKSEVFSDGDMIELETLGALASVPPGGKLSHREFWGILSGLPEPLEEEAVREAWLPAIAQWRKNLPLGAGEGA